MSDISNQKFEIKLAGETHALEFNVNIIDAFQDAFDVSFMKIAEMLDDERTRYKVVRWILYAMINENVEEYNEKAMRTGTKLKEPVTLKGVGRKLTFEETFKLAEQLANGLLKSVPKADEDEEDDDTPSRE